MLNGAYRSTGPESGSRRLHRGSGSRRRFTRRRRDRTRPRPIFLRHPGRERPAASPPTATASLCRRITARRCTSTKCLATSVVRRCQCSGEPAARPDGVIDAHAIGLRAAKVPYANATPSGGLTPTPSSSSSSRRVEGVREAYDTADQAAQWTQRFAVGRAAMRSRSMARPQSTQIMCRSSSSCRRAANERVVIRASLSQQRSGLRPLVRDGCAFGIMFVIRGGQFGSLDDGGDDALQGRDLTGRSFPLGLDDREDARDVEPVHSDQRGRCEPRPATARTSDNDVPADVHRRRAARARHGDDARRDRARSGEGAASASASYAATSPFCDQEARTMTTTRLTGTGIWSGNLRYGDAGRAAELATELEGLGYSALWIPDVGGDVFTPARQPAGGDEHARRSPPGSSTCGCTRPRRRPPSTPG